MTPATFASSYAYVLPVSTAPNAVAMSYSEGRLTTGHMFFVGTIMIVCSFFATTILCYALVPVIFKNV